MDGVAVMSFGNPKTGEEIELDVFQIVRNSLKDNVSGYVYRKDTRPYGRGDKEDVVVSFLTGLDGQIQTGVVIVNCYVPYITASGTYKIKDVKRTTEVSRLLLDMVRHHKTGAYYLQTDRTIETFEEENASKVTLRIKYKYNALEG